ncbi:MAG: 50S ribosomal protein L21 [Firmicutes bacterium]|nr:50S ribosomal protein L21 [Bacillota bacterium]
MYAIFESGGKQYKVSEGETCQVEKLPVEAGSEVVFDKVLLIQDGDNVSIGAPYLEGARISGKVLSHGKGKKIIVFKYKPKKNYRRKQGHRQPFTLVKIDKIQSAN